MLPGRPVNPPLTFRSFVGWLIGILPSRTLVAVAIASRRLPTDLSLVAIPGSERAFKQFGRCMKRNLALSSKEKNMADKRAFGSHCKTYNDYTLFMVQARDSHQDEWPTAKQVAEH